MRITSLFLLWFKLPTIIHAQYMAYMVAGMCTLGDCGLFQSAHVMGDKAEKWEEKEKD